MNAVDGMFTKDPVQFAGDYFDYVRSVLDRIDRDEVATFIRTLLDARDRGAAVFFIGNGGSASTASHFANDLSIGTQTYDQPFRVTSLTDNTAVLTALGNDCGFDDVFVRQLRVQARAGDVLVAISVSGNSPNLVKALEYGRTAGIRTVALTATDGGRVRQIADEGIHVPTGPGEYGPAEDAHLVLNHLAGNYLMRYVRGA